VTYISLWWAHRINLRAVSVPPTRSYSLSVSVTKLFNFM
jgi:hypothetical protein